MKVPPSTDAADVANAGAGTSAGSGFHVDFDTLVAALAAAGLDNVAREHQLRRIYRNQGRDADRVMARLRTLASNQAARKARREAAEAGDAVAEQPFEAVVAAVAAGSLAGTVYGRRRFERQHGWLDAPASPYWQQMRPLGIWTTAGAVIYWVHNQSYNYVLAVQTDLEAVAHANAARLMLMPTVLMLVGVSSLLMPLAAGWLHREGLPVVLRRLWSFALGLLVLVGGFGAWSVFSQISGAVVASGRIEVDRNRQIVQHETGGTVAVLPVTGTPHPSVAAVGKVSS